MGSRVRPQSYDGRLRGQVRIAPDTGHLLLSDGHHDMVGVVRLAALAVSALLSALASPPIAGIWKIA